MKKLVCLILSLVLVCSMASIAFAAPAEEDDGDVVIYLTRHGETMFNILGRNQGWSDTPLTENGIAVAAALGAALSEDGVEIDAFYSGDLSRQRETAKAIMEAMGVPYSELNENPNLREVCFGSSEGESSAIIAKMLMDEYELTDTIEIYTVLGVNVLLDKFVEIDQIGMAETFEEATARIVLAMDEIVADAQANGYDAVMAVSSGMIIAFLNAVYGTETVLDVPNCSITKVVYHDGEYSIEYVADTSELEKGLELIGAAE